VIFRATAIAAFSPLTPLLVVVASLHGRVVEVLFPRVRPRSGDRRRRGAGTWCEGGITCIERTHGRFRGGSAAAHGLVVGVAGALALWGAAAGVADASTRVLIGDSVVADVAGFLGVGLSGVIGGAVLTVAGPDVLPQVEAAVAVVVLIAAAVGPASNSRREGHRGPGALSAGSQDAR
jgi:hypothetical protein